MKCKILGHDWVVVEYSDKVWRYEDFSSGCYVYMAGERENQFYFRLKRAKKKVCLRCNKCIDEEKIWMKRYQNQLKEKIQEQKEKLYRENLAKKMWSNCNE